MPAWPSHVGYAEASLGVAPEHPTRASTTMPQRLSPVLWKQLLQRSAQDKLSLQARIREMLVTAILDGHLPAGMPIASSRELADELGVSRNTVVLAYQQLADEGYLLSRQRSGHFVNDAMLAGRVAAARPQLAAVAADASPDWPRRFWLRPSAQRSIVKPAD